AGNSGFPKSPRPSRPCRRPSAFLLQSGSPVVPPFRRSALPPFRPSAVPPFRRSALPHTIPRPSTIEIDKPPPAHSGVPFSHSATASSGVGQPSRAPRVGTWWSYVALVTIVALLVLQKTKQAMLPARQTPVLWGAVLIVLTGVLVLRSGW